MSLRAWAALIGLILVPVVAGAADGLPGFDASGSFCDAIWTDGEDRLIVSCNSLTIGYTRGRPEREHGGPREAVQLDGGGRGAGAVVAAVTAKGTAARLEAGRWEEGAPPDRDRLVAVAVDASARTWFVGERALHLWQGAARWAAHPYPAGVQVARAARGDGGVYLAARHGRLFHADGGGAIREIPFARRAPARSDDEVKGLWFGEASRRVYLLHGGRTLTVIDRRSGAVTAHRLPSWGVALTGVEAPGGDLVVIAIGGDLLGLHEGRLYHLARTTFQFSFVHQLAWNAKDGRLYIASQSGIFPFTLEALRSAAGRAKLTPVEGDGRGGRASGITWPGKLTLVSAAVAFGAAWNGSDQRTPSFTLDVELGLRMPFALIARRAVALWPTLGYSYDADGARGGHRFVGGLGLTFYLDRSLLFGVTAASRFIAGSIGDSRGLGVRSGLRLELFLGLLALDVAHEALFAERTSHGVRATLGIDLMTWLRVFRFFSFLQSPSWKGAKRAFGGLLP
jgi:hypothetical protein